MEGYGRSGGSGGLTQGNVSDRSGASEDAEPHVLAATKAGYCFDDVVSAGDFENVGRHGRIRLAGNEYWRLRPVFGARWAAPRPPDHFNGGSVTGIVFRGSFRLLSMNLSLLMSGGSGCGRATAAAAFVVFGGLLLAFGGGGDLVEGMGKWVDVLRLLLLMVRVSMLMWVLVLVVKFCEHVGSFTLRLYIFTFHAGSFPLLLLCIFSLSELELYDWQDIRWSVIK